jgi:DNA-binding transcriptional MerR regulator/methylmalonyl-CoA mutase cobalamin-binding subunit
MVCLAFVLDNMNISHFTITAVERDTGLSKDVLRMWERRYGFPAPERDANGERLYPPAQVERLHLIKRLMDQGHRPGKLMTASDAELSGLASQRMAQARAVRPGEDTGALENLLGLVRAHDVTGLLQVLQQRLIREGLHQFVLDTIAPMTRMVGEAWEHGQLEVFEEHLFTEQTKRVLRQAIAGLPGTSRNPRILLTSVPDEQHVLGLLMVEALFALEGAECIALGTQMPLLEIQRAAEAHQADIVALSFSAAFPRRQLGGLLQQLRELLPASTELWVGGGGVIGQTPGKGVEVLGGLKESLAALAAWRERHP